MHFALFLLLAAVLGIPFGASIRWGLSSGMSPQQRSSPLNISGNDDLCCISVGPPPHLSTGAVSCENSRVILDKEPTITEGDLDLPFGYASQFFQVRAAGGNMTAVY